MWVALLVAFVMTANSAEVKVMTAPQPFHSQAECQKANEGVEKQIQEMPDVKGYSFKCIQVTKEDVKANGKDS